ncbi:hypothetical protein PoB_004519800 [Plakobranchus ocellatus]|uniref:Uncharacterized protein n=1 Tax=Plakobranchus ocellatus TaxID=259542 RepID=A0AAV4BHN7_9GAST|nr:hypothetical protein PoB_004519800 [Plakobranchus ocellatus]
MGTQQRCHRTKCSPDVIGGAASALLFVADKHLDDDEHLDDDDDDGGGGVGVGQQVFGNVGGTKANEAVLHLPFRPFSYGFYFEPATNTMAWCGPECLKSSCRGRAAWINYIVSLSCLIAMNRRLAESLDPSRCNSRRLLNKPPAPEMVKSFVSPAISGQPVDPGCVEKEEKDEEENEEEEEENEGEDGEEEDDDYNDNEEMDCEEDKEEEEEEEKDGDEDEEKDSRRQFESIFSVKNPVKKNPTGHDGDSMGVTSHTALIVESLAHSEPYM